MLNILIDAFFPLLCSLQSKWYFGNLPEDSKDEVYCVVLHSVSVVSAVKDIKFPWCLSAIWRLTRDKMEKSQVCWLGRQAGFWDLILSNINKKWFCKSFCPIWAEGEGRGERRLVCLCVCDKVSPCYLCLAPI